MTHRRGLLVSSVLLLLLTGCASSSQAGTPAPAPSAVPSTSPSPDPVSEPEPAFGGDCGVVATQAEVSAATGGEVTPRAVTAPSAADWSIRGLGGIRCAWDDATGNGVWVTVIPTSAVGAPIIDEQSVDQPWCYSGSGEQGDQAACSFSATIGDWWYAGVVYTAPGSGIDPLVAIDALIANLGSRVDGRTPEVPSGVPGAWATVPECDALDALVETTTSVGVELVAASGNGAGEAGPGYSGALESSGYRACFWEAADAVADVALLPGASWVVEQQAAQPGAVALDVPGAAEAVLVPAGDHGAAAVYLSDGANLVTASGPYAAEQLGLLGVTIMSAVGA